jgi:hypothetical protein
MKRLLAATALLLWATSFAFGAGSRAHVYLFRGLADIFSTGMDTLADELNKRGVYATSHSHTEWRELAEKAAADYKAGKEGPIILIGHSLGADAVMEMADYLGDKGVPVALVMPFDGTQSFAASGNIGKVVNFTQRDYAYMRKGAGFRGTLVNVDVSSDPNIGHLTIDKAPRLHARAISEVLAVAAGHMGAPVADKPGAAQPSVTLGNVRQVTKGEGAKGEGSGGEESNNPETKSERETAPAVAPAVTEPARIEPAKPKETRDAAPAVPQTSAPAASILPPTPAVPAKPASPVSPSLPPQPPRAPARALEIPD